MTRRRGTSLIEMLAVMSIGAVVLGLSAGLIHVLLKLDRGSRGRLAERAAAARMADLFRADVHAARAARIQRPGPEGQPAPLALELGPVASIEWRAEPGACVRVRRSGGQVKQQETFPLGRGRTAALELEPLGGQTLARLRVEPPPQKAGAWAAPRAVEALVARDHRFESKGEP